MYIILILNDCNCLVESILRIYVYLEKPGKGLPDDILILVIWKFFLKNLLIFFGFIIIFNRKIVGFMYPAIH